MLGVNLSIWGSIPEGSERFSDESRGRQCCFTILISSLHDDVLPSELQFAQRGE